MQTRVTSAVLAIGLTICPGWAAADPCEASVIHGGQAEVHAETGKRLVGATIGLGIVAGLFFAGMAKSNSSITVNNAEQVVTGSQALSVLAVGFSTATSIGAIATGVHFELASSNEQLAKRFQANCQLTGDFEPSLPRGITILSKDSEQHLDQSQPVGDEKAKPRSATERCDDLRESLKANVFRAKLDDAVGRRMIDETLKKQGCPLD
jgi:hypothetical protein